ncbi:hypothetical protein [Clostridium sp. C8-1-8]|uniref:hypothetical protein n=1 Tax=Clostridium sp. C8-1-8 TaxID=2698831 RepID=UPI001368B144|nr:hypothetical protein [Clostridium sp. C8-1-8]
MEYKRILDSGDLESRIENTLNEFYWVNKLDINAKNDPFSAIVYVDPKLVTYDEVLDFIEFIGDEQDTAKCTICDTRAIVSLKEGFDSGKEFEYLIGLNELKIILARSYDLPDSKVIDAIVKVHEDIHILIKDRKPLPV